jgi:heptosyltransferase-3
MRRLGKAVERQTRRAFDALLDVVWPSADLGALPAGYAARKVLLVRPNFRIGNTVLATALLPALQARFPGARIDQLAGDTTACLLEGLPIDRVHCVSRMFIVAPWRFVALFVRLRKERYDVAVDGGMGSFSGALYAFLSGARERVGFGGRGDRFLTARLHLERLTNAYEEAPAFARALGVTCPTRPLYQVTPAEDAAALAQLRALGLAADHTCRPFIAAFVGGHLEKRWPQREWSELLVRLDGEGLPVVVFIGPEEVAFASHLRSEAPPTLRIVPPQPLRAFAALLARATLLLTPDSGPMHLAVAAGVPTVALLQYERSPYYAPRGPEDRVLWQPRWVDVLATLRQHPRWKLVAPRRGAAGA